MDLCSALGSAQCGGRFHGLQYVQRPGCFQINGRSVFHLYQAERGILYLKGLRIPWAEYVSFRAVRLASQLVEYLSGYGSRLVVVHHPQCDVQRMGSDVDQRTAALQRLVREYAPGRNRSSSQRMCLCKIDIPKLPCFTGSVQCLGIVTETVLVADGKFLAGFLPCVQHLLCVLGIVRHRLFAHHMLACLKGSNRDRAVRHVGGTYVNHINLNARIRQHFLVIGVNLRALCAVFFTCLLCPLRNDVTERYHNSLVLIRLDRRHMLLICDTAASNDCYSQFAHCFVLLFFFSYLDSYYTESL